MRVAVLAGGRSPEREVSLRSGHRVATALGSIGHEAELIDPGEGPLAETLAERPPDVCYLTLHGKEGEDGTVQRLLELLDIPYTGTGPYDCEIAFDKVLAKDALGRADVSTPAWAVVEDRALRDLGAGSALSAVVDRVGLPCVVKPSRSGSAMGVGFVERAADLPAAVMAALSFSGAAVVETKVEGSEVSIGLVGTPWEDLPLVEIVPKGGVYDYAARYTAGATDYFSPARVSQEVAAACVAAATRAALALGLRDVTRVDAIVDADGLPWVLEVNVAPGMTETSLLPMAAQAAGRSLADLCDGVLRSALAR
jgi:D-alanine-D-alanine ligase